MPGFPIIFRLLPREEIMTDFLSNSPGTVVQAAFITPEISWIVNQSARLPEIRADGARTRFNWMRSFERTESESFPNGVPRPDDSQ